MTKKTLISALLLASTAVAAFANTACSRVSSAANASTTVSGEAWYARTGAFGGLKGIYYCPAATPAQCVQAEVR